MADDESKIFIDEDWKAQVQREKEQAAAKKSDAPPAAAESADEEIDPNAPPEANFVALVSSLATQCMFALGLIAPRDGGQVMVDIHGAKFLIDLLTTLREKTKGNLDAEENGALTEAIAELQRAFVVRSQQVQESQMREAGIDLSNLRNPGAPPAT
jgi:hypothetical protein